MEEKKTEETKKEETNKEEKSFSEKAEVVLNDVKDESKKFSQKEIEDGRIMAILAYIIPLIPYFVEKNNKFVVFHAKQGMNLLILSILGSVALGVLNVVLALTILLIFVIPVINVAFGAAVTILCIIGIVNVCNGKAKELPIVNKFKIIK